MQKRNTVCRVEALVVNLRCFNPVASYRMALNFDLAGIQIIDSDSFHSYELFVKINDLASSSTEVNLEYNNEQI